MHIFICSWLKLQVMPETAACKSLKSPKLQLKATIFCLFSFVITAMWSFRFSVPTYHKDRIASMSRSSLGPVHTKPTTVHQERLWVFVTLVFWCAPNRQHCLCSSVFVSGIVRDYSHREKANSLVLVGRCCCGCLSIVANSWRRVDVYQHLCINEQDTVSQRHKTPTKKHWKCK